MTLVQTEEQRDAEVERRVQERVALAIQHDTTLPAMIEQGVERALRRVLTDDQLRAQFWAEGYKHLETHVGTNAAQWIGRRIINIIVVGSVAGLLAFFIMTGRAK